MWKRGLCGDEKEETKVCDKKKNKKKTFTALLQIVESLLGKNMEVCGIGCGPMTQM